MASAPERREAPGGDVDPVSVPSGQLSPWLWFPVSRSPFLSPALPGVLSLLTVVPHALFSSPVANRSLLSLGGNRVRNREGARV